MILCGERETERERDIERERESERLTDWFKNVVNPPSMQVLHELIKR